MADLEPVNILIGVGGTGAKVVEAALVLLSAGCGPRHVHVGLVDQDQANGNVARTDQLLNRMVDLRRAWTRDKSRNYVDWQSVNDRPDPGSTLVTPLFEGTGLWCPEKDTATLKSIVGKDISDDRSHLFDMLFMPGPQEQELKLREGYRGNAHVGATALVAAILESDSIIEQVLRKLMADPDGRRVNIMIVGSAFGGTGAAGFPTLARALHRIRTSKDFKHGDRVALGGLLMLPYFSFTDEAEAGEVVVTANDLLPKARLALEYYDNLFAHEKSFDRFYALGWEQMIAMGYHKAGTAEQCNPALAPELFAATAMLDFFANSDPVTPDEGDTQVMVSSRQDQQIRWRDLPQGELVEARLGQLLRFCIYWRYIAEAMIDEKRGFLGRKNWIQQLTDGASALESEAELNPTRQWIDHILEWAGTVEHMGRSQWTNGPWNLGRFMRTTESKTKPVEMVTSLGEKQIYDGFDELVRIDNGEFQTRAGSAIFADLTDKKIPVRNESSGLGMALATVMKAVSLKGSN
jgi:hypothetical protein